MKEQIIETLKNDTKAQSIKEIKERLGIKLRRKASCKTTINVERVGNFNPRDITLEMYNELKEKGYSQEQMAEAMGLSNGSAYAKRESGSIDFGVNEFAKYCSVLGFDNQKLNIFFKLIVR